MLTVSIRELMHNFSHYIKEVKTGTCITVLERQKPVADLMPHNSSIQHPGWKRAIARRKIKGESIAVTTRKARDSDR